MRRRLENATYRADAAADRTCEREGEQGDEEEEDLLVDLPLDSRSLDWRLGRVAHDLGLLSADNDETVHPARVPKLRTSEEHLFRSDGHLLSRRKMERSGVRVERSVGSFRLDVTLETGNGGGRREGSKLWVSLLDLEVGLSVQIRRLDVAETFGFTRAEEDHVGTDELVLLHSDDVPDLERTPGFADEGRGVRVEHSCKTSVERPIRVVSFLQSGVEGGQSLY